MANQNTNKATTNLPALPKLPKLPRKAKAKNTACGCGCGLMVARRFAPGHDGRLHAWVLRVERGLIASAPAPHTDAVANAIAERAKIAKAS